MPRLTKDRLKIAKHRLIRRLDEIASRFGDKPFYIVALELHKETFPGIDDGKRPGLSEALFRQVLNAAVEDNIPSYLTD